MNSASPLFWRRAGIVMAVVSAFPVGGLVVVGSFRLLAWTAGISLGELGGILAVMFGAMVGVVASGAAALLLETAWSAQ